ncbi:MAG: response regulator transcription factor [Dehalococcoidia bacterium]|nr:response regulator transcription factor [Dehalococcoidia bacterium]
METIHVLIADDHPIVREGLRALISGQRDMVVVGEAADGQEAVEKVRELNPDVMLLDLVMPGVDGIAAIVQVLRESPDVRILVLTSYSEDDKVISAIRAGALGYLLKDSSPGELLEAIRQVSRGQASLPPAVTLKLIREFTRPQAEPAAGEELLSERETEVLTLIARGLPNREIADALVISERTVQAHVSHILHKLSLPSRTQAALYALRLGLVDPN